MCTHFSGKGHQVVLAQRKYLNVSYNHQFVVVFMKDGSIDNIPQVLLVTFGEEEQRLCVPLGCVQQALAIRILAQTLEHCPYSARQLLQILGLLFVCRLLPMPCALARPAKPVKINRRMLGIWAVGAARRKRRLDDGVLALGFVLHVAVAHLKSAIRTATIVAYCKSLCGEITSRPVEIYHLPTPVGRLNGIEEIFPFLLVASLGRESERRPSIHHVCRHSGMWFGRVGVHDGGGVGGYRNKVS